MKHGKILSALLSAAILFGAVLWVPVSGADKALTLKAESRLTLDREAGCIRGFAYKTKSFVAFLLITLI